MILKPKRMRHIFEMWKSNSEAPSWWSGIKSKCRFIILLWKYA